MIKQLFTGILRDFGGSELEEAEIGRINRLYSARSGISQAIVKIRSRAELLRRICEVLVETGGFTMVWIGWHEPQTNTILPVAQCGDRTGYLTRVTVYADDRPGGRGPTGTAFREGRPCTAEGMLQDPALAPWHAEIARTQFRASAGFPIRVEGEVKGVLTVYAPEPRFFFDKEQALLSDVADDISFALDALALEDERRRAEAIALREKQFSDMMIESMPGIIYFYDDKGQFLRWNRNFELVSGYSAAEIAAMRPPEFFSPPDRPLLEERIKNVFEHGEASVEAPFCTKTGTLIPYFFTGRRVRYDGTDCLVGMGIDISERKRAEEELRRVDINLRQSEQKYRELVQNANSIILRWTRDGLVSFINEFGQSFFGYSEKELVGRSIMETIVPPRSEGRDLAGLMKEIAANPKAFEQNVNENIRRNGERVWISWTNRIYRAEGEVTEILSVGTDITELRRTHEEVQRLNAQLRRDAEELDRRVVERTAALAAALDRAEAADRTKSAFLATMSHELRTPLNSIIGFTGIILQGLAGPLTPEQEKQLGMVRGSARHLLALINDVLDISKIEAGELETRRAPFDVAAAIDGVIASVGPLAAAKGLQLSVAPFAGPTTIVSDQRRVEQIALNLLNNAIKFTDVGRITVTLAWTGTAEAEAFAIAVADTGIGIKPEDLPMLFQPFRQIDTGLARLHEGTGLGLAICQRLAGLLGGRIEVKSEWGHGSVFTLVLPAKRSG